tara:strand:- start:2241 stop:2816 length:576 start_codon:yes stop_codon:yes gene_type:complete
MPDPGVSLDANRVISLTLSLKSNDVKERSIKVNTFEWLEMSPLAEWVGGSLIGYPLMLTSHGVGMSIVVGILFVMNLRLLGFFNGIAFSAFNPLLKLAWAGFVLNFISGCALFIAQATVFIESIPFLIKIAAIFLAGINAAFIQNLMKQKSVNWDAGDVVSGSVRWLAISSLVLWSTVIVAGRMIAYLDVG